MAESTAPRSLQIDFVSDIACPWCAIGLNALEQALQQLQGQVQASLHFQPFELNPQMGAEGEDTLAYLSAKYGISPAQIAQNQANIRARGAELGFQFGERHRVWNTFTAHRLLHWAALPGQAPQAPRLLKHALLKAYHGEGLNPSDPAVLSAACVQAGLDAAEAAQVMQSDRYAAEVREAERFWQEAGIRSVPATVLNRRHLISGGQPVAAFVQALRSVALEEPSSADAAQH
jgi:predicted DsbA family dithiol-disulfide isomerase